MFENKLKHDIFQGGMHDSNVYLNKNGDLSELELQHNVRFNVDSETSMEKKYYKSFATQCSQAVRNSQTQYAAIWMTDESAQTETCMKDSKNQAYEAEFESERKRRLIDIGVQTGVLARVQHMYIKEGIERMNQVPNLRARFEGTKASLPGDRERARSSSSER
uniref:YqaJ domain-containing protein n=1 Tax=Angiostrongylus cantonensis TaxID=6313 RepID=A0A158P812_ANGCA